MSSDATGDRARLVPPHQGEEIGAHPQTHAGSWAPIIITSVLFGLAHHGQGVAPVPLMLLGMVMGYVYQRTHRVVPGMTCHLMFNAYSLALVWLQFGPP